MWDLVATYGSTLFSFLGNVVTTTTATVLLVGAVVLYVYSLIDIRVPKLIVTPAVAILVFAGSYIYGNQAGTVEERRQCDIRNGIALKDLNDKYLNTAAQLSVLKQQYSTQRVELEQKHSEERSDLLGTIKRLEDGEDKARLEAQNAQAALESKTGVKPSVVYLPSSRCFSTAVPPDIMRSINKAGRSDNSKP